MKGKPTDIGQLAAHTRQLAFSVASADDSAPLGVRMRTNVTDQLFLSRPSAFTVRESTPE